MKPRILLVDDERLILECLTAILEGADMEVRAVTSAAEAIAALAEEKFDLVVTDMAMEHTTSGYDVVRAAHQQPHRPAVIVLTALPIPPAEWKQEGVRALFMKGGQTPGRLIESLTAIVHECASNRESSQDSANDHSSSCSHRG